MVRSSGDIEIVNGIRLGYSRFEASPLLKGKMDWVSIRRCSCFFWL